MSKYAIPIEEGTLDLIQVLNNGGRPKLEEEHTWFIFETDGPTETKNHDIVIHDSLYEGKFGHVGNGYVIQMVK